MPTPDEILNGLAYASNNFSFLAWLWHLIFLALIIILIINRRPSRRLAAMILALPLISVGLVAFFSGNPFNAIVFLMGSLIFMVIGYRLPADQLKIKPNLAAVGGVMMIIYGWVYPHFVEVDSIFQYIYAAPVGLVPCPTLSIVIGFTLLFGGFSSRKWMLVLAVLGLFYGIVGVSRLQVRLDLGLLVGALFLALFAMVSRRHVSVKSSI